MLDKNVLFLPMKKKIGFSISNHCGPHIDFFFLKGWLMNKIERLGHDKNVIKEVGRHGLIWVVHCEWRLDSLRSDGEARSLRNNKCIFFLKRSCYVLCSQTQRICIHKRVCLTLEFSCRMHKRNCKIRYF